MNSPQEQLFAQFIELTFKNILYATWSKLFCWLSAADRDKCLAKDDDHDTWILVNSRPGLTHPDIINLLKLISNQLIVVFCLK